MKIRILILIAALVACLAIAACGDGKKNDGKDTNDVSDVESSDSADTSTPGGSSTSSGSSDSASEESDVIPPEEKSMTIAGTAVADFTILVSDGDKDGNTIAGYIADKIKEITNVDVSITSDPSAVSGAVISIGKTDFSKDISIGSDGFVVKTEDKLLIIAYEDGTSPYPAVTTVLNDSLFSDNISGGKDYVLESGFEISGKCTDYIIGDNEFNPFD